MTESNKVRLKEERVRRGNNFQEKFNLTGK